MCRYEEHASSLSPPPSSFSFSFSCLFIFILFFLFAIWSSTIGPTIFLFMNLQISYKKRINWSRRTKKQSIHRETTTTMEMKRKEEENMCTSVLTAVVVLSMACLNHFSSVSYLIEQWRSLVFLLLNVVLLAVYFTSTRPISGETHDFKTRRCGRLKKKKKKKKTRMACSDKKWVLVEETKRVCLESEETVKDCLLYKKEVEEDEDEFEPGRLSNEELNERVEAFITTFRQHLVLDSRRGRVRDYDQKMRSKDSDIRFLGREVTCSV